MDITDILSQTFRLYRQHFRALVTVMALVTVPTSLVVGLVEAHLYPADPARFTVADIGGGLARGALLFLIVGAVQLVAFGAVAQITSAAILGQPVSVMGALRQVVVRLGRLLLVGIIFVLTVGLLCVTVVGIPFAFYVGLGWVMAFPTTVLEGLGAFDAVRRSWKLASRQRWRLFGYLLLLDLIVTLLIGLPSGVISTILMASSGWNAVNYVQTMQTTPISVTNLVIGLLGQALFAPIAYITITLLYYDLRVRKEVFGQRRQAAEPRAEPRRRRKRPTRRW